MSGSACRPTGSDSQMRGGTSQSPRSIGGPLLANEPKHHECEPERVCVPDKADLASSMTARAYCRANLAIPTTSGAGLIVPHCRPHHVRHDVGEVPRSVDRSRKFVPIRGKVLSFGSYCAPICALSNTQQIPANCLLLSPPLYIRHNVTMCTFIDDYRGFRPSQIRNVTFSVRRSRREPESRQVA